MKGRSTMFRVVAQMVLIAAVLLAADTYGFAFNRRSLARKIQEGNRLYAEGSYDKALVKYNDAQIESPANPEILFNMGNVFYRQKKYKEAADSFQKSMTEGDVDVEAKALYNIGNALFQQGRLREALGYYKQALDRDPDDADTKYNIEYTEKKIKEILSKSKETMQKALMEQAEKKKGKQENAPTGEQKKEKEQTKDRQAAGEDMNREAEKAGEKKTQSKEGGEGKEEGANFQAQKKPAGKKNAENAKKSAGGGREMSKKEAEQFLSAFERNRKNNIPINQQKSGRGRGYYVEKDW